MNAFLEKIQETLLHNAMFCNSARQKMPLGKLCLVAVSGGPDSIALWHALERLVPKLGLKLAAIHLNHGLRGAESDLDEEWVRQQIKKSGAQFFSRKVDTAAVAEKRNLGIEETARALRYEFFTEVARAEKAAAVATGHTLDDQAETVLLRLVRGAGMDGLGGIPPVTHRDGMRFIRPLIETTRAEILRYLEQEKASYRTDSSNADIQFRRNFVRHELLPQIEKEWNPAVKEILARSAQQHRDVAAYIDAEADKWWGRAARVFDGKIIFKGDLFKKAAPLLRQELVKRALRRLAPQAAERFHFEHLVETAALIGSNGGPKKIDLPQGVRAEIDGRNLVLVKK